MFNLNLKSKKKVEFYFMFKNGIFRVKLDYLNVVCLYTRKTIKLLFNLRMNLDCRC